MLEVDASGRVRWANQAARRLAGLDEPLDPELGGLDRCRSILPGNLASLVRRCLDSGSGIDGVEASTATRSLSWSFRPVESEDIVGAFGFDVTDWKESESALRRKDDLLEAVGSAARIILESTDGRIPASRVLERLGRATGVSRVYLFRNHTSEDGRLLASQVAEWTQPHVEPQIDNPELQSVPYDAAGMGRWARELARGVTLAGLVEEFPPEEQELLRAQDILSLVVTPVLVGGRLWGFIGFDDCEVRRSWSRAELEILRAAADTVAAAIERQEALDALEQSREQLRHSQRLESVGRLAGGIAHDFNNLLTGILANAEILLEDLDTSHPARGEADEIRKSALRAAGLTRQLLAFSRKQAIHPSRVDLHRLVGDMEELIRRLIGENIAVETELDADTPAIWADPGQVEQVVLNLVVNARDAMPEGGRVVLEVGPAHFGDEDVAARSLDGSRPYVLLSVSDTGVGMDPETVKKAFDPFFTTKATGTGMGLSIIYGIARQSGGSAWIDSTPGEGTRVTVALPAAEGVPEESREDPSKESSEEGTEGTDPSLGGSETILVVEDDDAVRDVTTRILRRSGYQILESSSAEEGLTRIRSHGEEVDLLLTDIGLPDRSGPELADEATTELPDLPVLFMSGFPGQRAPEIPLADEALDFLPKPFTGEQLLRRVRKRLDQARGGHRGDA